VSINFIRLKWIFKIILDLYIINVFRYFNVCNYILGLIMLIKLLDKNRVKRRNIRSLFY
jgi:hypothetical protein